MEDDAEDAADEFAFIGEEADATREAGTTLEGTLDPNPLCAAGFGVRPAAVLLAEGEAAMAEAGLTRLGVNGAAAEDDDEEDDAADPAAGDSAVSATVLVLSGVPNDVPPIVAVEGWGRFDTRGAGRLMSALSCSGEGGRNGRVRLGWCRD